MRDFSSITDEEVKVVYETTPEVNQYHSWNAVMDCEPMYIALKNKLIAPKQEQHMEQPENTSRIFLAIEKKASKAPTVEANRRNTAALNRKQIAQIVTAVRMARNCLQCAVVGDSLKGEALQELAESQKILNNFNKY